MPPSLSATTAVFTLPAHSSASTAELPIAIACRKNEEIGTYEDGLLRPRKDTRSLIAWKEHTPFATVAPFATDARIETSLPTPFSSPDKDNAAQPATSPIGCDTTEMLQTNTSSNDFPPPQLHYSQEGLSINHLPYGTSFALFYPQTYQQQLACDVAVAEANRPGWNPAYHKALSPAIERANRVVEEFKLYFGDGKVPELLLINLQRICYLCGLCKANELPNTADECIAILKQVYVNVFDLVEAGRLDQQGGGRAFQVPVFESSKEFFIYCKEQGKICPRWIGKANPLFQLVMNRFRD